MKVYVVLEYETEKGNRPFEKWFNRLKPQAAAKITVSLIKMEQGNLADYKSVGQGVSETRLNFGPGYRIYFGRDGETLIILLGGGTKKRQQQDIDKAKQCWQDYKQRKNR